MSALDPVYDERVRDDECQLDGTVCATWTTPSGAAWAVVRFDGAATYEWVDQNHLRKLEVAR